MRCAASSTACRSTATIVIGEGERDEAPMLFIGEKVGTRQGPKVHIAVDPLEGTTLCAKDMPGSIAVMAMAEAGKLLHAPDVYMDKIAIGPGYARGVIDLDASPTDNIHALAKAKGVKPHEISTLIMDRPRHAKLIEEIRKTGCSIRLITDGDVAGVIFCTEPEKTGIDLYLGIGGAPEGVLAAAALRCVGGQMQGRLILDTEEKRERALAWACSIRTRNTTWRTWPRATSSSAPPASPMAACSRASSSART
jgi:fructose-1,6-bisphosphatase II / sedoheptulose-1,7-bisphosphatase